MNSNKNRVTLEDLLRVKRAEQPPATFWAEFEREMRAKQLAAIVEPRPWWAPFIRISSRVSHYNVPIGAAAVLALAFVSVSTYRNATSEVATSPEIALSAAPSLPAQPSWGVAAYEAITEPIQLDTVSAESTTTRYEVASSTTARTEIAEPAPAAPVEVEPSPSARYIAANLAAAQAADPRIMDDVFGPSVRSVAARQPVRDPLAQIAASGESRRSRLMDSALPAVATVGDVAVGSSDRVARRLTEERLYDSIRRVGLQGDRVAIKF